MPSLFVIQGRDQGKRFELRETLVSVGRDASNTVQLHDTEVSRHHVELRWHAGGYELVDLGSSNGTYVNSQLAGRHALASGDRVQVGRTLLIYTAGRPAARERGDQVEIVAADEPSAPGSRIIHSFAPEPEAAACAPPTDASHAWLARARSNLDVMYHTALAASHTLDIDQLLRRILDLIFEWVAADRGCVMLRDREDDRLVPAARKDRHGTAAERMEISRTILDYVLQHREGVLTSDARDDDRWDAAGSIIRTGVREAICVPMQGRYGIVGAIYLDTYTPPGRLLEQLTHQFTEEHLKLMVAIGHQAALAVEDTSYYSALVQAERLAAIGQTIATLSHHIKNILQGIRGGSYLVEEGLKTAEFDVISKGWAIVDKNQEKISHLVMDMLSFSKERAPDPVPADLNQVVSDVVELMASRAAQAGVTLQWCPDPRMPVLVFDPDAVHRAALNVVTNAIDACESADCESAGSGRVTVRTEFAPQTQQLRIHVEDNGAGIDPDDLPRIFSLFESRKGSRGTGLGLPVSQKIMREHAGDITVESHPQQGSRFCLSMPAIPPPTDAARRAPDRATTVRPPADH